MNIHLKSFFVQNQAKHDKKNKSEQWRPLSWSWLKASPPSPKAFSEGGDIVVYVIYL